MNMCIWDEKTKIFALNCRISSISAIMDTYIRIAADTLMANWFCSMFTVVCVVNVCPVSPRCRSELIDSAWVIIIVPGQKCIKKYIRRKIIL